MACNSDEHCFGHAVISIHIQLLRGPNSPQGDGTSFDWNRHNLIGDSFHSNEGWWYLCRPDLATLDDPQKEGRIGFLV